MGGFAVTRGQILFQNVLSGLIVVGLFWFVVGALMAIGGNY